MSQFTPADLVPWLTPWTGHVATFALVLARVSGLLAVGPLLGRAILPWQARVGLAMVLSLSLAPLIGVARLTSFDWPSLVAAAAAELGVGFLLGCGSLMILWAISLGGRLLDQQHTLSAEEDDDLLGGSPLARWLTLWGAACILLSSPINGHLQAVKILAGSFQTWPLGSATEFVTSDIVAQLLQQSCQLTLLLIAPALATLTLINFGLGLLGTSGLSGASSVVGGATRPIIAAFVLLVSLSGLQQTISDSVRDGFAVLADDSIQSR